MLRLKLLRVALAIANPAKHGIRLLPGSEEAARYLGAPCWRDSQGNVHWLDFYREHTRP